MNKLLLVFFTCISFFLPKQAYAEDSKKELINTSGKFSLGTNIRLADSTRVNSTPFNFSNIQIKYSFSDSISLLWYMYEFDKSKYQSYEDKLSTTIPIYLGIPIAFEYTFLKKDNIKYLVKIDLFLYHIIEDMNNIKTSESYNTMKNIYSVGFEYFFTDKTSLMTTLGLDHQLYSSNSREIFSLSTTFTTQIYSYF